MPTSPTWALPLYELAPLTAHHVAEHQARQRCTDARHARGGAARHVRPGGIGRGRRPPSGEGIGLQTGRRSVSFGNGVLLSGPTALSRRSRGDAPRLAGTPIGGLPQTADLSVRTAPAAPARCAQRVRSRRYPAFPVEQDGIAAGQAMAAAQRVAAAAGAPVEPKPSIPVCRAAVTGSTSRLFRAPLAGGHGEESEVASGPLWWPPGKISGHYLPRCLARRQSRAQWARPRLHSALRAGCPLRPGARRARPARGGASHVPQKRRLSVTVASNSLPTILPVLTDHSLHVSEARS